jgi:hypothetical protein
MTLRAINNSDWKGMGLLQGFRGVSGMHLACGKWRVAFAPRLVKVSSRAGHPATSVSNVLFTQLSELRVVANVIPFLREEHFNSGMLSSSG